MGWTYGVNFWALGQLEPPKKGGGDYFKPHNIKYIFNLELNFYLLTILAETL